jgi:uncharacterized membrane protein
MPKPGADTTGEGAGPMFSSDLGTFLYDALWLFLIYSFYGVIVEMIFCYAREYKGVVESRCGLLYLPLSPIYGLGGIAISLVLVEWVSNPFYLFFASLVICTTLEYIASFLMEKIFGSVFWDYSNKPLNLHGRICLEFATYWGFLGLLLIYVLDPTTIDFVNSFPRPGADYVLTVLLVITGLSLILTLMAFVRFDQKVAYLKAKRDGQPLPHIDTAWGRMIDRLVPDVVMINTFPRMSHIVEYMELSGQPRKLVVWDLHLGKPTVLHQQLREHNEKTQRAALSEAA